MPKTKAPQMNATANQFNADQIKCFFYEGKIGAQWRTNKLNPHIQKFGFINGVDNVNCHRLESLYGGQFTLSTPLIKPNFCILLPHRRSTTVSLETTPSTHICSRVRPGTSRGKANGLNTAPRLLPQPLFSNN